MKLDWPEIWRQFDEWRYNPGTPYPHRWDVQKRAIQRIVNKELKKQEKQKGQ